MFTKQHEIVSGEILNACIISSLIQSIENVFK